MNPDGPTLVVHARPDGAVVEKAVRDTTEWIRHELETCGRLSRERPFPNASFRASRPLPHHWTFPESTQLQIRPRNDDYVYIDGAFRPDTAKLLELLSGIQLYKEPLAAVRELLQNAFDAVKEQIALLRLEGDPADSARTDAIIALQSVELHLEERDGCLWLLCTDSGVGMTRPIIEKYLLVSGSARRHDILDLERRCEAAGFHLGRTGQFGIGVLSYFILADRVEILTRRSVAGSYAEPHGWRFETEGVGSFGELRKDPQAEPGTTVGLRLRNNVAASRDEFLSNLRRYLLNTLLRIPCSFKLIVEREAVPSLRLEPGWLPLEDHLVDEFLKNIEAPFRESIPQRAGSVTKSHLNRLNLNLRAWPAIAERFRSAIQWKFEVGQVPGELGHYRLAVPFFELPGGRSLLFLDLHHEDTGLARPLPIVAGSAMALQPKMRTSFHGMAVSCATVEEQRLDLDLSYLAEIDWEDPQAGQITVDRGTFSLTNAAIETIAWLRARGKELQAEVLSERPGDYASLNTILNPLVPMASEASWFVSSPGKTVLRWEKLSRQVLNGSCLDAMNKAEQARGVDRIISVTQQLRAYMGGVARAPDRVSINWGWWATPSQPAIASMEPLVIIPQYLNLPRDNSESTFFLEGKFPTAWSSLAALGSNRSGDPWLWNRNHPLVQAIGVTDLQWFATYGTQRFSEEILQSKGRSALYLMKTLEGLNPEWWRELSEDYRAGSWRDLWGILSLDPAEVLSWVQQSDGKGFLWLARPEGIERIPATDPRIPQYLPDPGDEWKVTITYQDDSAGED